MVVFPGCWHHCPFVDFTVYSKTGSSSASCQPQPQGEACAHHWALLSFRCPWCSWPVQNLNLFLLEVPKVIASWEWTPGWNVSPSLSRSQTNPKQQQQLDHLDGVSSENSSLAHQPYNSSLSPTSVAKEENWLQKLVNYFHIQRNPRPQISHKNLTEV